jgi:hypothetical protein
MSLPAKGLKLGTGDLNPSLRHEFLNKRHCPMVSSMPIGRNSKQKTKRDHPASRHARRIKHSALLVDAKELLIHARCVRVADDEAGVGCLDGPGRRGRTLLRGYSTTSSARASR